MSGSSVRTLTVGQWCSLVREDSAPSVSVLLEGDSMRPLIRKGIDPVSVAVPSRELKVGDVVLFVDDKGRYVVHRVWRLGKGRVRTLGDNCRTPEPWFSEERVLGMAVSFRRNGRVFRLDAAWSRAWGRVWMATYPVRRAVARVWDKLAGRVPRTAARRGEGGV